MEKLLTELRAALKKLSALILGYHGLVTLLSDQPGDERVLLEVTDHLTAANSRLGKILTAIDAIQALVDDGYPALPHAVMSAGALKVIVDEIASLQLALFEFESAPIATLSVGPVIPAR